MSKWAFSDLFIPTTFAMVSNDYQTWIGATVTVMFLKKGRERFGRPTCSSASEMPFRIPVIGRLGFTEYQSLVLALTFFFFEALIRLMVMFIPQFVLRFINQVIYAYVRQLLLQRRSGYTHCSGKELFNVGIKDGM